MNDFNDFLVGLRRFGGYARDESLRVYLTNLDVLAFVGLLDIRIVWRYVDPIHIMETGHVVDKPRITRPDEILFKRLDYPSQFSPFRLERWVWEPVASRGSPHQRIDDHIDLHQLPNSVQSAFALCVYEFFFAEDEKTSFKGWIDEAQTIKQIREKLYAKPTSASCG